MGRESGRDDQGDGDCWPAVMQQGGTMSVAGVQQAGTTERGTGGFGGEAWGDGTSVGPEKKGSKTLTAR